MSHLQFPGSAMLSQIALSEFKELYLKEYGVHLTDKQAVEYGIKLIKLIKPVYIDKTYEKSNN